VKLGLSTGQLKVEAKELFIKNRIRIIFNDTSIFFITACP
jgi:hypothetical protein